MISHIKGVYVDGAMPGRQGLQLIGIAGVSATGMDFPVLVSILANEFKADATVAPGDQDGS